MEKKNIGIMTWSLNSGGAERAVANLSEDLSDKYNVYILIFDSRNIVYPYNGKLLDVGVLPSISKIKKVFNAFERYKIIKNFKKKYKIEIVISFMPQMNIYNILTRGNGKAIISIRNNMTHKAMSYFSKRLMVWSGKRADITISLSEGVRQDLIKNFKFSANKVKTIYNSCDIQWLFRENKEVDLLIKKTDFSRPTIVTVGRLTHQKGQWHLLRAFSILKKYIPEAQLVIFGHGELLSGLKKYSEILGIREDTNFMGFVKNHHKYLSKCDVFVLPSLFEGLGNAVLESLACELPTISTNCPSGPSEILDGKSIENLTDIYEAKYGILTPAFSEKNFSVDDLEFEIQDYKLAKAMQCIIEDKTKAKYYRNQAKLRIQDFSPKKIKKQWYEVIEEVRK